jgi:hypothetical protein
MLGTSAQMYQLWPGRVATTQGHSRRRSLPRVQPARALEESGDGFRMAMDGLDTDSFMGIQTGLGQAADMDAATPVSETVAQTAPAAAAAATTLPIDLGNMLASLDTNISNILQVFPDPLQGALSTIAHDILGLMALDISFAGSMRLAALYYVIFTRPSPISAIIDYYILRPLSQLLGTTFSENDFTLRDRLGNGNYGQGMWLLLYILVCTCVHDITPL